MPVVVNLDVMLAKRKMKLTRLSELTGISLNNLSILNCGKARAIRLTTMNVICEALECQPGDLFEYIDEATYRKLVPDGWWYKEDDDDDDDD